MYWELCTYCWFAPEPPIDDTLFRLAGEIWVLSDHAWCDGDECIDILREVCLFEIWGECMEHDRGTLWVARICYFLDVWHFLNLFYDRRNVFFALVLLSEIEIPAWRILPIHACVAKIVLWPSQSSNPKVVSSIDNVEESRPIVRSLNYTNCRKNKGRGWFKPILCIAPGAMHEEDTAFRFSWVLSLYLEYGWNVTSFWNGLERLSCVSVLVHPEMNLVIIEAWNGSHGSCTEEGCESSRSIHLQLIIKL